MFSANLVVRTLFIVALGCLRAVDLVGEDATGVTGKVVDKAEHTPVRNAYVLVHRIGGTDKSFRTDESGKYVIELLPSVYDVFISARGFAPTCRKIEVPHSGMVVFDPVLDVGNVGMQESSSSDNAAPGIPRGTVGDIPGGLPPDGKNVIGEILSSKPQLPRVAVPTRIRVAQGVMRSFLVTKVNPIYPPEAKRQKVDGKVLLHISIDKTGNVSSVDPVSGHPLLIPAAIDAVKQWKYKPYLLNQKPIEVETMVLIEFVISGGNAYSVVAFATQPASSTWR